MSAGQDLTPLQAAVDEVVSAWPEVRAKGVFGHRGYVRAGKMFAFQADEGVSVKAMTPDQARDLYAREDVVPFEYTPGMKMTAWPVLPLRTDAELDDVLSLVRRAYESVT